MIKSPHNYSEKMSLFRDNKFYSYIPSDGKSIREYANDALHSESDSRIDNAFYILLKEYLDTWDSHRKELNQYDRAYREFRRLRKQVKNWLSIIGLCEVENEDEIMIGYPETDDYTEQTPTTREESDETSSIDDEINHLGTTQEQIDSLLEIIDSHDFDNLELKGFSSDGIFCFIDDCIYRSTVETYRNGKGWKAGE